MARRVILYVEDDNAAFLLAEIILKEQNPSPQLIRASDGAQALAMLRRFPPHEDAPRPDLILLDLNLPKKTGLEVLAELKGCEELRSIPVVVFSTSASRSDVSDSLALGAHDYVRKPSSFHAFVEAMKLASSMPGSTPGPETAT
jgi:two-component system, chemotaxis family, response regulator Rcp1